MSVENVRREFEEQLEAQRDGAPRGGDLPGIPAGCWDGAYGEFRDIAHPASEAADEFHYAVVETVLSMAVGRAPYVQYISRLRLNCSVVAMGPTGDSHKGTPAYYAEQLLTEAGIEYARFSNLASIEGLQEQLRESGRSAGLVVEPEMSIVTDNAQRPGTKNLPSSLCHLYDCPDKWVITKRKSLPVEQPYVCVLGTTTPDWGERLEKLNVATGGWLNRQFMVYGDSDRIIPRPPRPDGARWARFVDGVCGLHDFCQRGELEIRMSDEAGEWFDAAYTRWKSGRRVLPGAQRELSARIDVHALKGAAKRALWRKSTIIEVGDLEPSWRAAEASAALKLKLFAHAGLSEEGKLELLAYERHPGDAIRFSRLHELVGGRYSAKQLLDACHTLQAVGRLMLREQKYGRGNKFLSVTKV
jgi:hypothetical protein